MNNYSIYKNIGYIILILFVLGIIVGFILWTQQMKTLEINLGLVEGTEDKKYLDNFVFVLALYSIGEVILGLLSVMMFVFARVNRPNQGENSNKNTFQSQKNGKNEVKLEETQSLNVVERVVSSLQEIIALANMQRTRYGTRLGLYYARKRKP